MATKEKLKKNPPAVAALVTAVCGEFAAALEKSGLSVDELAGKMHCSAARVRQFLDAPGRNKQGMSFTLASVARFLGAWGFNAKIVVEKR